jgi:hypothetical protein
MSVRRRHTQALHSARTWKLGSAAALLIVAAALSLGNFGRTEKPVDLLVDFHQYHYGAVPEDFDYDATGSNGPVLSAGRPFWRVYLDRTAPSPELTIIQAATLAQPDHYPIALLRDVQARDVMLSVHLKPMGGTMDQSQGLLWRVQDKDSYYAVLANALQSQLHLFKMVDGKPEQIASASIQIAGQFEQDTPTATWGWYSLQVETDGGRITVWFDGEKTLEATDQTFMHSGKVGLITHADSVALFDDLAVQVGVGK